MKPKKSGLSIIVGMGKSQPPSEAQEPMEEEMGETPEQEMAEGEPEPEQSPDKGYQYLTPPPSFKPPEDKQMGQEFTGTYRGYLMKDGRLCVTSLNDIPLDGSKSDSEETDSGETDNPTEEAAESPANAQDEGGALEEDGSSPHMKESKKLKALLHGR